jgi:drug/metabolite transporter (DMT)-like permease
MFSQRAYLLLPLLAAVLYTLAAMGLKSATAWGFDTAWMTIAANLVAAAAFLIFVPWGEKAPWPQAWWPVVAEGAAFFLGQLFSVLALTCGDVSIATPLLGSKVVLVAFLLAVMFHVPVTLQVWAGAAAAALGIAALQGAGHKGQVRHAAVSVLLALLAAGFFGLFDVLTQVWSPRFGYGRVVPPALVFAAVLSLALLPFSHTRPRQAPRAAWVYLILGVGLMTIQSLLLITVIGKVGDAAGCNIVYGSRGIWSVLLVCVVGRWFGNREGQVGRRALAWRLAGAALILLGVVLVFTR